MSEMIERVARAICDAVGEPNTDCTCEPGTCLAPKTKLVARAAIAAMREPLQSMQDAGIAQLDRLGGENNVKREDLDDVWRAMIDAALSDAKP